MAVLRIVPNIAAEDLEPANAFYGDVLGLKTVMDLGFIVTYASGRRTVPQISIMTEGGSGMPVPELSVEVDNLDEVLERVVRAGFPLVYGPAHEPWGVRRFFVRDPFGRLVNVLMHE